MVKLLKVLVLAMGITCVAIGLVHFLMGIASVPGEGSASATVDSRERFYGALFLFYGLAWIWAGRQSPIPASAVRWLTGALFVGGIGRLVSLAVQGRPQWFQLVLTGIELALPPLYWWLAPVDEVRSAQRPASASTGVEYAARSEQ